MIKNLIVGVLIIGVCSCHSDPKKNNLNEAYPDINIVGAMKKVMWKGELQGTLFRTKKDFME